MKRFLILSVTLFAMFFAASCGGSDSNSDGNDNNGSGESGFNAVDVGECRFDEPPLSFKDRIYTEQKDEFSCKEYVEVTAKAEKTIKFNWFGEMHCGIDWEYGYKIEGIENNVLKVSILERDTDLDLAAGCDDCCYLMPIEYTASSAEEIDSIKTIEINYEGKNHKAAFPIEKETTDPETPDEEVPVQCEDSEGRIYNEGDSISHECRAAYCCGYGDWCEDESECYHCPEIGGKMEWTCADGVTKVEWCECVEINDETYGTEWKCADRVDLNCPKE